MRGKKERNPHNCEACRNYDKILDTCREGKDIRYERIRVDGCGQWSNCKTKSLVISFDSTYEAMKMQSVAEKLHLPGRIIPTPQRISAGCGMAWLAPVEAQEGILKAMEEHGVLAGEIAEMEYRSRWAHEKRT